MGRAYKQCVGFTKGGKRCRGAAQWGHPFCGPHIGQNIAGSARNPVKITKVAPSKPKRQIHAKDKSWFEARYAGVCSICLHPVKVGEKITQWGDDYAHYSCAHEEILAPVRAAAAEYAALHESVMASIEEAKTIDTRDLNLVGMWDRHFAKKMKDAS